MKKRIKKGKKPTNKTEVVDDIIPSKTTKLQTIPVQKTYDISTLKDTADLFANSGMFKDSTSMAQCFVKIMAGREWGINPFSAMQNIHIIQGKPAMAAGLISSLIKKSGKYNYKILEHTNKGSKIEFFENGQSVGTAKFDEVDAYLVMTTENGKQIHLNEKFVWKSYPEAMYFNRALTKGARMYCPDVFDGAVYVPEELNSIEAMTEKPIQAEAEIQGKYSWPVSLDFIIPDGDFKGQSIRNLLTKQLEYLIPLCDNDTADKLAIIIEERLNSGYMKYCMEHPDYKVIDGFDKMPTYEKKKIMIGLGFSFK